MLHILDRAGPDLGVDAEGARHHRRQARRGGARAEKKAAAVEVGHDRRVSVR
jgi:hypothetical protein